MTPLFADPQAFAALVADLAAPFQDVSLDYVAGIEALGFILGTAVSLRLGKGFIPIRKAGKLPVAAVTVRFVDYSGQEKRLELRRGGLPAGARVLLVDEWVETGSQVQAAIELIEGQGGVVAGIAAINIDSNPLPDRLCQKYFCHAVWLDMQQDSK